MESLAGPIAPAGSIAMDLRTNRRFTLCSPVSRQRAEGEDVGGVVQRVDIPAGGEQVLGFFIGENAAHLYGI